MRTLKWLDKSVTPAVLVTYNVPEYGDIVYCVDTEMRCTEINDFWHGAIYTLERRGIDCEGVSTTISLNVNEKEFISGNFVVKVKDAEAVECN